MLLDPQLPELLLPFREPILATALPFVELVPRRATNTTWWQSRIGGLPYLPAGTEYPAAPDGRHLLFLAQLNFAEMPPLPGYPASGILQLYGFDDARFGCNPARPADQSFFRVLYFPEITTDPEALVTDFSFLRTYKKMPWRTGSAFSLSFDAWEEVAPTSDYRFDQQLGPDFFRQFGKQTWDVRFDYDAEVSAAGHKVGGYADFANRDPRDPADPMLLLLQLDTDEEFGISWGGDFGLVNCFIRPGDLARLDFSAVWYWWESQ